MPEAIAFATKPQIALAQIRDAANQGMAPGVVLADVSYGADMAFQGGLLELDLAYVVVIQPNTSVWLPGTGPCPPRPGRAGAGRQRNCAARPGTYRSRQSVCAVLAGGGTADRDLGAMVARAI